MEQGNYEAVDLW